MKKNLAVIALAVVVSGVAQAETMYTVYEGSNSLATIDTSTGATSIVGALGVGYDFGDLAYDSGSSTMYMVDGWGTGSSNASNLYSVNLNTGAATLIGSTGVSGLFGLAYDGATGKLFGGRSTSGTNGFYEIDKTTGAATLVGDPQVALDGMTYVGSTGDIVGLFAGPGDLYSIDRGSANATLLGGSGFVNNCGIAWSAASNTIYAVDWSAQLYAFDISNGYSRTVVANLDGAYDGLAAVPEPASMVALGAGLLALARRRKK